MIYFAIVASSLGLLLALIGIGISLGAIITDIRIRRRGRP